MSRISVKPEIIERKGKRFAVVPLKAFEQLVEDAEMLDDIRAYDAAKQHKEESFPAEVVNRILDGGNPIRVFREYRGMTQEAFAKAVQIARPYVTELESGRKKGSISVLRAVAGVLKVELDDIAS